MHVLGNEPGQSVVGNWGLRSLSPFCRRSLSPFYRFTANFFVDFALKSNKV
jgi:hypothetical protein